MKNTECNIIKKCRKLCSLIILAIIISSTAAAQNHLTAAVPEEFRNSLELEILISVSDKLETELEVKAAPFARRLHYMKTGGSDITACLLKNKEREEELYASSIFQCEIIRSNSNQRFRLTAIRITCHIEGVFYSGYNKQTKVIIGSTFITDMKWHFY